MFGLNGSNSGDGHGDKVALADHCAEMVGSKGFEASYPHELSGDMLKCAELARAFVVKPDIPYMNEPFSALDALMNLRMRTGLLRILREERHTVHLASAARRAWLSAAGPVRDAPSAPCSHHRPAQAPGSCPTPAICAQPCGRSAR